MNPLPRIVVLENGCYAKRRVNATTWQSWDLACVPLGEPRLPQCSAGSLQACEQRCPCKHMVAPGTWQACRPLCLGQHGLALENSNCDSRRVKATERQPWGIKSLKKACIGHGMVALGHGSHVTGMPRQSYCSIGHGGPADRHPRPARGGTGTQLEYSR